MRVVDIEESRRSKRSHAPDEWWVPLLASRNRKRELREAHAKTKKKDKRKLKCSRIRMGLRCKKEKLESEKEHVTKCCAMSVQMLGAKKGHIDQNAKLECFVQLWEKKQWGAVLLSDVKFEEDGIIKDHKHKLDNNHRRETSNSFKQTFRRGMEETRV